MFKLISEDEFNELLYKPITRRKTSEKMVTTTITDKVKWKALKDNMTYDDWLIKYKGKSVNEITINEHAKWAREFRAWKVGNIE